MVNFEAEHITRLWWSGVQCINAYIKPQNYGMADNTKSPTMWINQQFDQKL